MAATLERPRAAPPAPAPAHPGHPPRQSTRPDPTRSRSTTTTDARSSSNTNKKKQQTPSGYVDVIDKLDLSGLDMSYHHSGPFDAARAKGKGRSDQPAPIAAFSSLALDPSRSAVDANGADLAPHRPSNNGRGLSARANATLAAMDGREYSEDADGDRSTENLLTNSEKRNSRRRGSDSSITLGFPAYNNNGELVSEKERQYMEAFGVHVEAYEDFGRSSYAKRAPRASVYPSDLRKSNLGGSGLTKEGRADRTASIWDIEATLRAGRPVGASSAAPPPMPIIPQHLLNDAPPPLPPMPTLPFDADQSPSQPQTGIKRSKSLLSRMRSKKDKSQPGSPDMSANASFSGYSSTSSKDASFNNGSPQAGQRMEPSSSAGGRPLHRGASSNGQQGLTVNVPDNNAFSPSSSKSGKAPLPSPLGLPEPLNYDASGKPIYGFFDDAAGYHYESATAAILADSSSKESNLSSNESSHLRPDYNRSRSAPGSKTMTPDTSFASSTTTGAYYSDENVSPTTTRSPLPPVATDPKLSLSPKEQKLNRKPSFAKRLLGGRGKKRQS